MQAATKADVGIQLTSHTTRDIAVGQTPRPLSVGPPVAPTRSVTVPVVTQSSGTSAAAASFREQMLQAQREAPQPQSVSGLPAFFSRPHSQPSLASTPATSPPRHARSDSETAAAATDAIRARALAVIDEYKREHAMTAEIPQSRAAPQGRETTDARQARDWRVFAVPAAYEPGTYDGVLGTGRQGLVEEATVRSDDDAAADRRSSSHSTSSLSSEALAALVLGGRSRGDIDHSASTGDAVMSSELTRSSQGRPVAPVRGLSQPQPSAASSLRASGAQNDDSGFRLRPASAGRSGSARSSAEREVSLMSPSHSVHPPPSVRSSSAATQKVPVGPSSSSRLGSGHTGGKKGRTPEQALRPVPGGPTAIGSMQKVQWPRSTRF